MTLARAWPMAAQRTVCSHHCLQTWTFGGAGQGSSRYSVMR